MKPISEQQELLDKQFKTVESTRRKRCSDCGKEWADPPSRLCPGCYAYREHIQ